MAVFVLRRLAGAIPLLLALSFLALGLTRLTGENFFDRYKADKRFDPSLVRRLEREARVDRPFPEQWLHWLRGVCFDLRIERPRHPIADFETDDWERIAGLRRLGSGHAFATAEDSTEGRRAGRFFLPAGVGGFRMTAFHGLAERAGRTPDPIFDPARYRSISVQVRNPSKVPRRLEFAFEAGERRAPFFLDLEPGPWVRWEIPVARIAEALGGREADSLLLAAPGSGEFFLDDLVAVEDRFTISAGAPDFGRSFEFDAPVFALLGAHLWNSFLLGACALLLTWAVALPAGIAAAVHRNRLLDRGLSLAAFAGMSVPAFFLALLVLFGVVAFAHATGSEALFPVRGAFSADYGDLGPLGKGLDRAHHLLLPTLVLSAGSIAGLQRIARGNLLEALRSRYVLTARAKGLPESRVVYGHALRNAVNPLLSIFGTQLAGLLSGAALTEIVFGYPGMGNLLLRATISKDLYVVVAAVVLGGALLVLGNLLADVALRAVDPRIRFGASRA